MLILPPCGKAGDMLVGSRGWRVGLGAYGESLRAPLVATTPLRFFEGTSMCSLPAKPFTRSAGNHTGPFPAGDSPILTV